MKSLLICANVKARRLGYLKLLLIFLKSDSGKKYALTSRFAQFACKYSNQLHSYKDQHGEIFLKNAVKSARPYIQLAESLRLIGIKNDLYKVTKQIDIDIFNQSNLFNLSISDIRIFLELIINTDSLGLLIASQVVSSKWHSYTQIIKKFENQVLSLIDEIHKNHFAFPVLESLIGTSNNRLGIDSFLLPRFHWLFDMNMIEIKYTLTKGNRTEIHVKSVNGNFGKNFKNKIDEIRNELSNLDETRYHQFVTQMIKNS